MTTWPFHIFFEQVFPVVLEETNCYLHQDVAAWKMPFTQKMEVEEYSCFMALTI
jgi:hypothetical protein